LKNVACVAGVERGRGESVRVIACVPVVSWILITKKGHDDGNHYFNILKTAMFGEFWSEKGLIQVGTHFVHGGSLRITERSIRALVLVVQK